MSTTTRRGSRNAAETLSVNRHEALKRMLVKRQDELVIELQSKMHTVRADSAEHNLAAVDGDDIQDDLEFALIQMKAETLNKINEALVRVEEGQYGLCFECGDEIAQLRLHALPFAVRCKECEEAIETADHRHRIEGRRGSSVLRVEMR